MKIVKLFESEQTCNCRRCGAHCQVDPIAGSKAKMLKRSEVPKGMCLNCAMHDWLRNTYPVNLLLAQGGQRALALPQIQETIAGIMKSQFSDAAVDEIDFEAIIEKWDLPFANKLKSSSMNPVDQAELDRYPAEEKKREEMRIERLKDPRSNEEIFKAKHKEAANLLLDAMRDQIENS